MKTSALRSFRKGQRLELVYRMHTKELRLYIDDKDVGAVARNVPPSYRPAISVLTYCKGYYAFQSEPVNHFFPGGCVRLGGSGLR